MKGTLRKSCAARFGLHRGVTERSRRILRPTPTENERRHTYPLPCLSLTDVYIRLQTAQLSRDDSLRSILSEYLTSRLDQRRQLSLRHHDGNANGTRFIQRQQIAVPAEEHNGNAWHDVSYGAGRVHSVH